MKIRKFRFLIFWSAMRRRYPWTMSQKGLQVSTDNWDPGLAGENGDEASVIEEHTTDTPQTQIVPLGSSGDLLMVYVDDAGNIKNAGRLVVNAGRYATAFTARRTEPGALGDHRRRSYAGRLPQYLCHWR